MILGKGEKLLFIGDSITDCGRAKPEGEGGLERWELDMSRMWTGFCRRFIQNWGFEW